MTFNKLRSIPKLSKVINARATPNYILMKHLLNQQPTLNATLKQDFVNNILSQKLDSKVDTIQQTTFHFPLKGTEELPYHVSRSKFGQLPIYLDYKNGRTKVITIVRKIKGDVEKLKEDIKRITGEEEIVLRAGNNIEVKGNHSRILRLYLRGVGF
ncbi:hypothetical protein ABK040_011963 [Willaertia magna]